MKPTIANHYDTGGQITAHSDPESEFLIWRDFVKDNPDWSGDEFEFKDFVDYIKSLKTEDMESFA